MVLLLQGKKFLAPGHWKGTVGKTSISLVDRFSDSSFGSLPDSFPSTSEIGTPSGRIYETPTCPCCIFRSV